MSTEISPAMKAQPLGFKWLRPLVNLFVALRFPALGITSLLAAWWLGGYLVANDPDMWAFANFAPAPTFHALYGLVASGEIWPTIFSSLYRILYGLFWGIVIGVPVGVLIGYIGNAMKVANVPFQFLRMISPLAWMPIAVLAFHKNLQEAVNQGQFRLDLFYRLNVFPIHLPPLRDRDGDVRILARHFLLSANREYGRYTLLGSGVIERLESYNWPGNIRQLENVV